MLSICCIAENRLAFPSAFCLSQTGQEALEDLNRPDAEEVLAEQFNQPRRHTHH